MSVNHIDNSHGIWDFRYTQQQSYFFMETDRGKLLSLRDYREPDPESETILNMSEYILKLVQ